MKNIVKQLIKEQLQKDSETNKNNRKKPICSFSRFGS